MPRRGAKLRSIKSQHHHNHKKNKKKTLQKIKKILSESHYSIFKETLRRIKWCKNETEFNENIINPWLQLFNTMSHQHILQNMKEYIPEHFVSYYTSIITQTMIKQHAYNQLKHNDSNTDFIRGILQGNVFTICIHLIYMQDGKQVKAEFEQQFIQNNFPYSKLCDIANSFIKAIDNGQFKYRISSYKIYAYVDGAVDTLPILPITRKHNANSSQPTNTQYSIFRLDITKYDEYCICKETENEKPFDELTKLPFKFDGNVYPEKRTKQFFYYPKDENTLISLQHIYDENKFNFDSFCTDVVLNKLNNNLHGKWKIINAEKFQNFQMNQTYTVSDVQFHHRPSFAKFGSTFTLEYKFEQYNKMMIDICNDNRQIIVSNGSWKYNKQFHPCIIIVFINCQYSISNFLPLDYRSIKMNSSWSMNKNWCLYYDFNDRDRCPYITPRMAYKLFEAGISLKTLPFEWETFPDCCKEYLTNSFWKASFIAAIDRVLFRLTRGKNFSCNCTAEEMVVHKIIDTAYEYESDDLFELSLDDEYQSLPDYGSKDKKYEVVTEFDLEDADVLMLYDKKLVKYCLDHKSWMHSWMNVANLHPSTWYLAFRRDEFLIDCIKTPLNEGTIWTKVWTTFQNKLLPLISEENVIKYNGIKYKSFVEKLFSNFGNDVMSFWQIDNIYSYPMISIALNRKVDAVDANVLSLLSAFIKLIQHDNSSIVLNELICILLVFNRLNGIDYPKKTEYFSYLSKQHDLLKCIINSYYLCLFSTPQNEYMLSFYSIILSIVSRELYHSYNFDYKKNRKESEYLCNWLNDVSFDKLELSTIDTNNYPYDLYLRAPITCVLNRRTGTKIAHQLRIFYNNILNGVTCFNKHCGMKRSIEQRFKVCKGCHIARYCSKHCQKIDWKLSHNKNCKICI
eukprot:100012_1